MHAPYPARVVRRTLAEARVELHLPESVARAIEYHAIADYPSECCGLVIGTSAPDADPQIVTRAIPLNNRALGEQRHRFAIAPDELLGVERNLAEPERVLGLYHSHPDGPASPSESDRREAWEQYVFIIQSLRSRSTGLHAYEFHRDRFNFAPIRIVPVGSSRGRIRGSGHDRGPNLAAGDRT